MDYDIVDGITRPRLQMQSGEKGGSADEDQTNSLNKAHAGICVSVGVIFLAVGFGVVTGLLQFVAVWLGLSLVLGPFAPLLVTGGDCRVGVGEPVLPEPEEVDSVENIGTGGGGRGHHSNPREKHNAPKQPVEVLNGIAAEEHSGGKPSSKGYSQKEKGSTGELVEGEREWDSEDIDLLRKLMVKHPRGTLRRWEVIAEGLGGRHSVDSIVKMSKALGQKKVGDEDSYSKFLSQRKVQDVAIASPLSRREETEESQNEDDATEEVEEPNFYASGKGAVWTEVEDKALLTALKTFPKDTPMRWDKVALALPGRSKTQCFRRFSDLRKSFRSTKRDGSATQDESLKD
ncbi:unnamed protein product [Calypogeia fissa]